MNEIRVARKAFDACLISSAVGDVGLDHGGARAFDQRGVHAAEDVACRVGLGAVHHAVGTERVRDRLPLAEELGVRGDVDGDVVAATVELARDDVLQP